MRSLRTEEQPRSALPRVDLGRSSHLTGEGGGGGGSIVALRIHVHMRVVLVVVLTVDPRIRRERCVRGLPIKHLSTAAYPFQAQDPVLFIRLDGVSPAQMRHGRQRGQPRRRHGRRRRHERARAATALLQPLRLLVAVLLGGMGIADSVHH